MYLVIALLSENVFITSPLSKGLNNFIASIPISFSKIFIKSRSLILLPHPILKIIKGLGTLRWIIYLYFFLSTLGDL